MLFLLAAFGLAYIAGHSTISLGFRTWLGGTPAKASENGDVLTVPKPGALGPFGDFLCALIECPACFGFWIGLLAGATDFVVSGGQYAPDGFCSSSLGWPFMLGCATSASNFVIGRLTRLI